MAQTFSTTHQNNSFNAWLENVGQMFASLSSFQRNVFIDKILSISNFSQILHITAKLQKYFKQDFSSSLPTEILLRIFEYLDNKSLVNCSNVCKDWNNIISTNKNMWFKKFNDFGIYPPDQNISNYVEYFLKNEQSFNQLNQSVDLLFSGHSARITALCYFNGKLATG